MNEETTGSGNEASLPIGALGDHQDGAPIPGTLTGR